MKFFRSRVKHINTNSDYNSMEEERQNSGYNIGGQGEGTKKKRKCCNPLIYIRRSYCIFILFQILVMILVGFLTWGATAVTFISSVDQFGNRVKESVGIAGVHATKEVILRASSSMASLEYLASQTSLISSPYNLTTYEQSLLNRLLLKEASWSSSSISSYIFYPINATLSYRNHFNYTFPPTNVTYGFVNLISRDFTQSTLSYLHWLTNSSIENIIVRRISPDGSEVVPTSTSPQPLSNIVDIVPSEDLTLDELHAVDPLKFNDTTVSHRFEVTLFNATHTCEYVLRVSRKICSAFSCPIIGLTYSLQDLPSALKTTTGGVDEANPSVVVAVLSMNGSILADSISGCSLDSTPFPPLQESPHQILRDAESVISVQLMSDWLWGDSNNEETLFGIFQASDLNSWRWEMRRVELQSEIIFSDQLGLRLVTVTLVREDFISVPFVLSLFYSVVIFLILALVCGTATTLLVCLLTEPVRRLESLLENASRFEFGYLGKKFAFSDLDHLNNTFCRAVDTMRRVTQYVPKNLVLQLIDNNMDGDTNPPPLWSSKETEKADAPSSPKPSQDIQNSPGKRKGKYLELREISVMLVDIKELDRLLDGPPETTACVLREFFEALSDAVTDAEGLIDEYFPGGGGVGFNGGTSNCSLMCCWGFPNPLPEHQLKAVKCALKICNQILPEMRQSWKERDLPMLKATISISSSSAYIGNFGIRSRFHYTAIGDAVDLAARLRPLNQIYHSEIVCTPSVYEACNRDVCFIEVGQVALAPTHANNHQTNPGSPPQSLKQEVDEDVDQRTEKGSPVLVKSVLSGKVTGYHSPENAREKMVIHSPFKINKVLTEEDEVFVEEHRKALEAYYSGDFARCLQHADVSPLSSFFQKECRHYLEHPRSLPPKWNGTRNCFF